MASVIKFHRQSENAPHGESFNFEDVAARARQYIAAARQQATETLESAQQDAERIRREAVEIGRRESAMEIEELCESRATEIATGRLEQSMADIRQLAALINDDTNDWLRQWQHATIPLAISIAEKLVARQIELDASVLMDWLEEGIRLSQGARKISVAMHPKTAQRLESALNAYAQELSNNVQLDFIQDETLDEHGMVLRTEDGKIDLQLSSQLERLSVELT